MNGVNMKFQIVWATFLIGLYILSPSSCLLAQPMREYTDGKISLDFKDAEIRNALKTIAEVAGINMVVSDEVKGRITLRLIEVPWDLALEVTLQSQSLGLVRTGNVIQIAPLQTLRKERETQLASKRAQERMEDIRTEIIRLKYAIAKDMVPIVKSFLSERGTVGADERTNTLIIRDISENIEAIKGLFR